MTEFSVANKINDNVTVELLSELSGELESALDIFHTISVHVENWRVNCFGDISAVGAGSGLAWVSCETNLVVYDNVDGTADFVVIE